jgi:hypothetical protein
MRILAERGVRNAYRRRAETFVDYDAIDGANPDAATAQFDFGMARMSRMRRAIAASGCLRAPYLGATGAGDCGGGAAPVVPDGVMISATRLSFGSINKTVLLSSLIYSSSLAAGT